MHAKSLQAEAAGKGIEIEDTMCVCVCVCVFVIYIYIYYKERNREREREREREFGSPALPFGNLSANMKNMKCNCVRDWHWDILVACTVRGSKVTHRTPPLRGNPKLNLNLNSTQICKNKVDESFRHVQTKIKLFVKNFLLQHLRSRAPQKAESEVKATMKKHMQGCASCLVVDKFWVDKCGLICDVWLRMCYH